MALQGKELTVGQVHSAQVVQDLKRTQIVQYAGASGDYNPIHTDEPYARDIAGYPTVFAHGMLTMGMTGAMLTDYVGDGRLTKFGVRFTSQVWPGDDLKASAVFEGLEESADGALANFAVETVNQDGAVVLSGYAQARVD